MGQRSRDSTKEAEALKPPRRTIADHPELVRAWHPTLNGTLTPRDVTAGANRKVWWLCAAGHEWPAWVMHRTKGVGCPFCAGKRATPKNSLAALRPHLLKEWHATRNGARTPHDVTASSAKPVWWRCAKGHSWDASPLHRARCGCPYCSGHRVCSTNCLARRRPALAAQWAQDLNGDLTPKMVTPGSAIRVWWRRDRGPDHVWEAPCFARVESGGCPFCAGKRASVTNNLASLAPLVSKQWHPTRNKPLTPSEVTAGSGRKVWWRCEQGHAWMAPPHVRVALDRGCPECRLRRRQKQAMTRVHKEKVRLPAER